jgi:uroporphyrin-III C-methyltransferase
MHKIVKPIVTLGRCRTCGSRLVNDKRSKALTASMWFYKMLLVNEELLSYAPSVPWKIFVGKEKGHAYTQDQINQLIGDNALTYGHKSTSKRR